VLRLAHLGDGRQQPGRERRAARLGARRKRPRRAVDPDGRAVSNRPPMPLPASFLDAARRLVRADTVSASGTLAALDVLEPLWRDAGLPVQLQQGDSPEQQNGLAGPGGADARPGGLLLVTHLDTVPPGPAARWTETGGDPFALTEKDGVLFGLGCADVKLDALCKAAAALRLKGRRMARPFWLLGTFGEEVGLRGARHFAGSDLFQAVKPRHVLCGEPSELQLITAHKGYAVVRATVADAKAREVSPQGLGLEELTFAGKAAHSSAPHLGANAIDKALAWSRASGTPVLEVRGGTGANVVPASCTLVVSSPRDEGRPAPDDARLMAAGAPRPNLWRALATAGALADLWRELVMGLAPRADARFDPAGAVCGLNVIASAERSVSATLDARLLPQHDADALIEAFRRRAAEWMGRLGRGEMSLLVEVERNAGGMALADDAGLVTAAGRALRRLGLDPSPRAKPTSTEAGVFARAGCEAAVIGPGRSTGNAHTPNERIELSQLERAVDLYEALILEMCD